MKALFKMATEVQKNEQESGSRWGVVEDGGAKQSLTINQPPGGTMPLEDSEGKSLKSPKGLSATNVYQPGGKGRKMAPGALKIDTHGSVRGMLPGQPKIDTNGSVRQMGSGQPKLEMSTGGFRRMGKDKLSLTNASGTKV